MRILHTSDWHLGRTFHGRVLDDAQAIFADHLVELARTEAVARIAAVGATHLERLVNAARNIGTLPVKRDGHAAGRAVEADS